MLNLQTIDLKKEIKELIKNDPGRVRGVSVRFFVDYVKQKQGEEGLRRVIAELKRNGYELPKITKIDDVTWIPSSTSTIFMLASAKVFNWQEKEIIETGKKIASVSSITRIFIKYFLSPKKTFKTIARNWGKYYTFGKISITEYDRKQKRTVARLTNYKRHPIVCMHLRGVFARIIEMSTGTKKVVSQETKCEHRGDPYHEFEFRWE